MGLEKDIYRMKADLIQAAAHPIRLAIIELLKDEEVCVCEIAEKIKAGRSNVSRHLSLMTKAGMLSCRKDGLKIFYKLKTPCILNFLKCVDQIVAERLQESAQLLESIQ